MRLPNLFLSLMMASLFCEAHSVRALMCGRSERVREVSVYSTFGGTSGYTVRVMYPSSSKARKVAVNIFCEISGISRCSSLKRSVSLLFRFSVYITRRGHLLHRRVKMFRIGQSGNTVFSVIVLFIIVCISNCCVKDSANRMQ